MINNTLTHLQSFIDPMFSINTFNRTTTIKALGLLTITGMAIVAIRALGSLFLTQHANQSSKTPTSSPCYIFLQDSYQSKTNKLPPTYFEKTSKKIIKEIVKKIRNTIQRNGTGDAVGRCFLKLIDSLGQKRMKIAKKQETDEYIKFGQKRSLSLFTPLYHDSTYGEYGKKFTNGLLNLYKNYRHTLESGSTMIIRDEKTQEYTSKFTLQLVKNTPILANHLSDNAPQIDQGIAAYKTKMYEKPDEDLGVIYGHMDLEKNGVPYSLSDYFVFINKDFIDSPFEEKAIYHMILAHQDPRFIKNTMKEVKDCFIKCVNSQSEQELKENVAIFRYLFAHMAPYNRGSASIAEWIEKALYKLKCPDKEFRYGDQHSSSNRRPLADLDALTAFTLSEFMEDYLSKIRLKKVDPKTSPNF